MQKGQTQVLILAGIVLLIAVAGGIFYLGRVTTPKPQTVVTSSPQPSPLSTEASAKVEDPTANWKIYRHILGYYSVGYLPDWVFDESLNFDRSVTSVAIHTKGFYVTYSSGEGIKAPEVVEGTSLDIRVENNPNFKSYEDFKNFMESKSTAYLYSFASQQEIMLDGQRAMLKTGGDFAAKGRLSLLYAYKNGRTYELTLTSPTDQNQLFNQILSTFKFTD